MNQHSLSQQDIVVEGRVYVLRIWHEGTPGPSGTVVWRASVREGPNGERRGFASVDDCIEYLYGELLRR
jgi:hypothetical protein